MASTDNTETTPLTRPLVTNQPLREGALAYDPNSACTTCCGGLSMYCFRLRDDSRMEVIRGTFTDHMNAMGYNWAHSSCSYKYGWEIRECFEPACYGVPAVCNRSRGVLCSMGGCDEVPAEYDHALELTWHYFASPLYSWKRSVQCCAGIGLAADVIAVTGGNSAAIVVPSILGLPVAVMGLSCLTPRLCPKLDYLCYSNSYAQCGGYAAACLPWATVCGLVALGI